MEDLKFGKWSYSASCSTDDKNIWLIEMKNGEKRWYARYNFSKHMFIDGMPQECIGSELLSDSLIYNVSIAI